MSRANKFSESPSPFGDDIYEASPGPSRTRTARRTSNAEPSMSPSPAVSTSSDKENRSSRHLDKGKGRATMGPPSSAAGNAKRRRAVERDDSPVRSRRRRTVEADEDEDIAGYDPDQDVEERRRLRKGLRDLNKNLNENRSEVLNPNSSMLRDTLRQADSYAEKLKQTSDATIDSRLLVTTADLSYKKTIALVSGDTSQGVDVDEFISKCMSFMRGAEVADDDEIQAGQAHTLANTQYRRGRQAAATNEEDGDEDGDMLNWEHLGRFACLQSNSRPPIPGFLLGPLSLEKRAKRVVVRKAPLRTHDLQESRPEVLQASDIHKDENANLTNLCTQILKRLGKVLVDAQRAVDAEGDEDMTEEQVQELMDKYGVSQGGLALFKFVINPRSFGQTVENIFYVSFLIRDGKVGLSTDDRGMPYLEPTTPRNSEQREASGALKHQSVISLDFAMWEELIDLFDIKNPMIKHREEEEHRNVGKKGWYA